MFACRNGSVPIVEYLLQQKVDVDDKDLHVSIVSDVFTRIMVARMTICLSTFPVCSAGGESVACMISALRIPVRARG